MAPAHVPHTGFVLTNSRRGSSNPETRARTAMVVDSARSLINFGCTIHEDYALPPPGMIRASHERKSSVVFTRIVTIRILQESFWSTA